MQQPYQTAHYRPSEPSIGLAMEFGRLQATQASLVYRVERLEVRIMTLEDTSKRSPARSWSVAVDWKMTAVIALLILGLAGLYTADDIKTLAVTLKGGR